MSWIKNKLQQLQKRHPAQSNQATKQHSSNKANAPVNKEVNSKAINAKQQAAKIGKDLKAMGATEMKNVSKISAPTNAGTKNPGSYNYQPKGLSPRGKGKGKGLSR